jgi:hypothetical protein
MKSFAFAILMGLGIPPACAGEGRVLFVCESGTATCELAAQRFEAQSRLLGWHLAARSAFVEDLTEADLALAVVVVTIDALLYRHWLLSIKRYEAWNDIPPVERDRPGAEAAIDRRLQGFAASIQP